MPELLSGDEDVRRLAGQVHTLAEFLLAYAPDGWEPPQVARQAIVQKHCHQHAIIGFDADTELMKRAGVDAEVLDSGSRATSGSRRAITTFRWPAQSGAAARCP